MRTVVLIKDFAGKEKGHEFSNLGTMLCSNLVNTKKVAVYKEDYKKPKAKKSGTKKVVSENVAEIMEHKGLGKKVK